MKEDSFIFCNNYTFVWQTLKETVQELHVLQENHSLHSLIFYFQIYPNKYFQYFHAGI